MLKGQRPNVMEVLLNCVSLEDAFDNVKKTDSQSQKLSGIFNQNHLRSICF